MFGFEYRLILSMFYETFQDYRLGVFMIIVYKAPVSLTSVFKHCYSLDLEKADFDRQNFNILGWTVTSSVRFENPDQTYLATRNHMVVAI